MLSQLGGQPLGGVLRVELLSNVDLGWGLDHWIRWTQPQATIGSPNPNEDFSHPDMTVSGCS